MTNSCLSIFLHSRKQAITELKEKFNLDVRLDLAEYCKKEFQPKEDITTE